ncbi:family 43 glycosylhydrolase [Saccharothrix sp. NRRL B-16314]|uniref:family 43 glycosylhydrolase n=1 Tax=Saccharothrix sp. NRRL B-16314 TaxID=1463825 RepID=UPI001E2E0F31|nr:family 43 glycosylhydrolase [Saccharothrix sp. NRRL B-16314]
MTRTSRTPLKRRVLTAAVLLFASVLTPQSVAAGAPSGAEAAPVPPAAQDTPGIEDAADDPHGLKKTVADYRTRIPTKYTTDSWKPFAKALTTADDVAKNPSVSAAEAAAAKTALVTAAGDLEAADEGTFQTITNNTFWNDTSGNPIYSQGGGVFKFGDTYYWYGVHYRGAESYRANPTRKYDGEVSFVSIPVYSSRDLVNWKFENRVATRSTAIHNGNTMASTGWVGRLGVAYNENTGKYVLATQAYVGGAHGVLLLQGNTPTSNFTYGYFQGQVVNSPTTGTGDQTVFTDEDGKDYLIFSNREGRSRGFVSKFRESDSLRIEPGVEIRRGDGREGNAMFKLDGKYYHAASDLHGWNTSVNYVNESTSSNIQGSYSSEFVLPGTEMDYSHVTQTGFFVTVKGTKQNTVIYAGDRWADFAWNGIGYNQWVPITKTGARPQFHSVSQWQFNVTTGEWRVGPANNYILNPDIQADRIIVSSVRGWRNLGGSVTNVNGGVNGSRFALQVSNSGGVEQRIGSVPAGTYTLSSHARGSAGQIVITGADGSQRTLGIPSSSGWAKRELTGIALPSGAATVTVRALGSGGVIVDQLSLVRTDGVPPTGRRYEAETAPAVCQGTIDSNQAGFSGTGFCNGTAAVGAYAQFTVDAAQAGAAALSVRFANGSSSGVARPVNVVVNGSTVGTVSFEATGAWTTWSTKSLTAALNAGSNTIRLEPTTADGLPNVDYLDVGVTG